MSLRQLLFPVCLFFFTGPVLASPASSFNRFLATDTLPVTDTAERVFERVEIEAKFAGGDNAWRKFLEKNVNAEVAVKNKAPEGTYTVVVQFVVDRDGNVTNITALTNHGYGMEEEVIRLLRRAPKWEPAIQDGRRVKAYRKQPVTFQVIDDRKKKKKNKDKDDR